LPGASKRGIVIPIGIGICIVVVPLTSLKKWSLAF
jgi:hypothetical protein